MKRKYINLIIVMLIFLVSIDVNAGCASNGSTDPGCANKSCDAKTELACNNVNGQYARCCKWTSSKVDNHACYADSPYRGLAKNFSWLEEPSGIYQYKHDNLSKDQCKTMETVSKCKDSGSVSQPKETVAKTCEGNVSFSINDTITKCGDSSSFYTITCSRNVDSDFDYGDDNNTNTSNELVRGIGFKYGINVKTTVNCSFVFNANSWLKEYNKIMNRFKTVNGKSSIASNAYIAYQSSKKNNDKNLFERYAKGLSNSDTETVSRLFELYNLASDLEKIINTYNNYNEKYDAQVSLDMSYAIKGSNSKTSYNYTFDKDEICTVDLEKNVSYNNEIKNAVPWIETPKNYNWYYQKIVSLYPSQTYIDKRSGEVKDNYNNALYGGNKIYIDYDANEGQTISPINIKVTGLAGNNSSVINNMCSLYIKKTNVLYRPIDVSNPFINDSWTPGKNWLNSMFDFRNIIDKNIWSK